MEFLGHQHKEPLPHNLFVKNKLLTPASRLDVQVFLNKSE